VVQSPRCSNCLLCAVWRCHAEGRLDSSSCLAESFLFRRFELFSSCKRRSVTTVAPLHESHQQDPYIFPEDASSEFTSTFLHLQIFLGWRRLMMPFHYLYWFFMGRKISSLVIILNIKASPSFSLRWRSSA
jgi:hypothetical protein